MMALPMDDAWYTSYRDAQCDSRADSPHGWTFPLVRLGAFAGDTASGCRWVFGWFINGPPNPRDPVRPVVVALFLTPPRNVFTNGTLIPMFAIGAGVRWRDTR